MFRIQLIVHYYHWYIACYDMEEHRRHTQREDTHLLLNGQHGQGFELLALTQNGPGFGSVSGSVFLKSGKGKKQQTKKTENQTKQANKQTKTFVNLFLLAKQRFCRLSKHRFLHFTMKNFGQSGLCMVSTGWATRCPVTPLWEQPSSKRELGPKGTFHPHVKVATGPASSIASVNSFNVQGKRNFSVGDEHLLLINNCLLVEWPVPCS